MIPKLDNDPKEVTSYRPISLLSVTAKLLERLLLHRISTDTNIQEWVPIWLQGKSFVQQMHRINHVINKALEGKKYCIPVFLDVSRAFDKVWHPALLFKIKQYLPISYFNC